MRLRSCTPPAPPARSAIFYPRRPIAPACGQTRCAIGKRFAQFPLRWPGLRRVRVAFYGATGGHYAGVTGVALMQRGVARFFVKAEAFEVNTPLPAVVTGLNDFQPDVLFGYTTALKILGDEQRAGRLKIRPMAVMATGEMVTQADMHFYREVLRRRPASSIYACTEHMMMGISNPDGETMTLMDDNVIFEIYEDHTLITNLFNYTMPLIRYRMSDILRVVSAPGARRIVIENLVGRMEQMPTFVNSAGAKDFISPHTINEVFVQGVTRFQMQITGPSSFRFPICVDAALSDAARNAAAAGVTARLREILQQKGLGNVTFEVPIVAEIPLNERTRKFQLIVQRRLAIPDLSTGHWLALRQRSRAWPHRTIRGTRTFASTATLALAHRLTNAFLQTDEGAFRFPFRKQCPVHIGRGTSSAADDNKAVLLVPFQNRARTHAELLLTSAGTEICPRAVTVD